jgi:hypothetical protein
MSTTAETKNETLRGKTLDAAKQHKASWIELGQYLFSIQKDKLYRDWGYLSFETYCSKELSIKEQTASKLLKSYSFLEREEPRLAAANFAEDETPKNVPNYESVNVLRLAKENKKLPAEDFADLRDAVINEGKEPKEVRAQMVRMLSAREVKDPADVRKQRRNAAIKRMITVLSNSKRELESEGLLPDYLSKQIADLASKLQDQIES